MGKVLMGEYNSNANHLQSRDGHDLSHFPYPCFIFSIL